MLCSGCKYWSNDINNIKLSLYKNTDADIGNGYCEIGMCQKTNKYKYFDGECDMCEYCKYLDNPNDTNPKNPCNNCIVWNIEGEREFKNYERKGAN